MAKKVSGARLKKAAAELNKVLGLEPEIDVDQDVDELADAILEAAELLEPEDELSKATEKVISDLQDDTGKEEVAAAADTSTETEEEGQEEVEEEKKEAPKAKEPKNPGVIATIVSAIEKAGKKGITKEEILDVLVEAFPDRSRDSMAKTVNVQVPTRISRERFPLEKTEDGRFYKA